MIKNKEESLKHKTSNRYKITSDNGCVEFQLSGRQLEDINESLNSAKFIFIGNTIYKTCDISKIEFLGVTENKVSCKKRGGK